MELLVTIYALSHTKIVFHKRILERGEEYYEEGLVSNVTKTDSGYCALVEGNAMYEVEIEVDDSDGGSTQVANTCYEMWKQVLQKCNEEKKEPFCMVSGP